MADLITPLVLLGIGAYALLRDDGKVGPQAALDPTALDMATEMRTLPDGSQARYFRASVSSAIMTMLAGKSLEPVTVTGGAPGLVFKVVPLAGFTAQAACLAANAEGFCVFGSLSLPVTSDDSDKLIMFASPSQRSAIANPASKLAIVLDAGPSATTSPGSPGTGAPFDPGLPPELAAEINAAMSDPNADPDALDKMANELEAAGFPVAAATLRKRAAAIRLQDKMRGGYPFLIRGTAQGNAADLPFNVALHYTGDGNRWKEIVPANPKLGMIIKSSQWGPIPDPWKAGLTVLLPLEWKVRGKALPKPVKEPSQASQKAAEQVQIDVATPSDEMGPPPPPPAPDPEPTEADRQKAAAAIDAEESADGALHRSAAGRAAAIEERARAEAFLRKAQQNGAA